ncbi:hypothetical protein PHYPO_G00155510 [Pangasianodon hypophthalmus]|uniref:Reverse transcriptase domain-containing protein n=1 Tax=Pangasianodon hypophthalmus TaxID=310915 RepID=A0A5N5JWT4_PANHP|nr:hypothetical protein PHYPO_G00155510 [Pangasianodon hypophthalmus]
MEVSYADSDPDSYSVVHKPTRINPPRSAKRQGSNSQSAKEQSYIYIQTIDYDSSALPPNFSEDEQEDSNSSSPTNRLSCGGLTTHPGETPLCYKTDQKKALGAPPKIVALLKLLYSNAQSCVRVNGRDSDWFPISSGVRQGCVAAPDLFNCIIDHLMSKVCERVPGVPFGSYHLTDLEYADDTILLSTSYSQLRGALAIQ